MENTNNNHHFLVDSIKEIIKNEDIQLTSYARARLSVLRIKFSGERFKNISEDIILSILGDIQLRKLVIKKQEIEKEKQLILETLNNFKKEVK